MINVLYVLIALGVCVLAMFGMFLWREKNRRVWMRFGKSSKSKGRLCYLEMTKDGSGVVYSINGKEKLGQIVKTENDYAVVSVTDFEQSEYDGREKFLKVGLVNERAEVRKGLDPESKIYGYTANPDNPGVPSTEGALRRTKYFRKYWELDVYRGEPDPENSGEPNSENGTKEVKKKPKRWLAAKCEVWNFPQQKEDDNGIPDIVRAAAFMLLYKEIYEENKEEAGVEFSYGWRDTAFVSMLIYILIYLVFIYSLYCAFWEMPFIGQSWQMGLSVALFYFAFWGFIRQIKINLAESGTSVQPWLDMLNSKVGISWITFVIWFFSIVSVVVSFANGEKNYELLPLQIVVFFGLFVNKLQKGRGISKPWRIVDKYELVNNDDDGEDEREMRPPSGTIQKTYEWNLGSCSGKSCSGQISMFFDEKELSIQRQANPFYMQRMDMPMADCVKEMFRYLKKRKKETLHRVNWIAKRIKDLAQNEKLNEHDIIQFVIDFVQEPNIRYSLDQDSRNVNYAVNYIRFPDETLFDKEGDADCKAFLAAMIFYAMKYNVVFMYSKIKKHAVVAVRCTSETFADCKQEKVAELELNDGKYILCECTGDDFFIGHIISGIELSDFETVVPLSQEDSDEDED